MSYLYRAFGLNIESEITLLAPTADGEPDLVIRHADCPGLSDPILLQAKWIQASKREVLITIEGLGSFYINDGQEILMDFIPGCDYDMVRTYLMGTCMGAILIQRGQLPLHGSCITKDDNVLLITGDSGAGKSTMAAEFLARGWSLMSDDVTTVFEKDGIFYAQSSYPGQKLWKDAIERSQMDVNSIATIKQNIDNEKYQLNAWDSYQDLCLPLTTVLYLSTGSVILNLDEFIGFSKTNILMNNLYRGFLVTDKKDKSQQFKNCMKLAEQVTVYSAIRPAGVSTEAAIADWLLEQMEKSK